MLCIGAGIGALATAIAAVDAGADVLIATAGAELATADSGGPGTRTHTWLPGALNDDETDRYLVELVDGFAATEPLTSGALPVRVVRDPEAGSRTVPTFVGSRVATWAGECLVSITGAVFTTVRGWTVTEMRDADGRQILVAPVGDVLCRLGSTAHVLHRALIAGAQDREVEVAVQSPLNHLVFDGGAVVGAVLGAADQQRAVGTRHGVVLAPDVVPVMDARSPEPGDGADSRVCLVSIPGSRFARVELLSMAD